MSDEQPKTTANAGGDTTAKASKKKAATSRPRGKQLVEFTRNLVGPPRRSKGQRCWMTPALIKRQGLTRKDYRVVKRGQA